MTSQGSGDMDYFEGRPSGGLRPGSVSVPHYLKPHLLQKDLRILDLGCGMGRLMLALRSAGAGDVTGADVSRTAVRHCRQLGLQVSEMSSVRDFAADNPGRFDRIVMSHVLEHLPKEEIVPALVCVRSMLREGGRLLVMVPNAQSPTGAYWAYEDFTHSTIFTAGSLLQVLRAAGYEKAEVLDPIGIEGLPWPKRMVRLAAFTLYRLGRRLVNLMIGGAFHRESPEVYTFEVKAVARSGRG